MLFIIVVAINHSFNALKKASNLISLNTVYVYVYFIIVKTYFLTCLTIIISRWKRSDRRKGEPLSMNGCSIAESMSCRFIQSAQ